jgi:hypothetical protein
MILTKFDPPVKIRPFGNLKDQRVISRVKRTTCIYQNVPLKSLLVLMDYMGKTHIFQVPEYLYDPKYPKE